MTIFQKAFWIAATERAVKTAAQAAILAIGADKVNVLTLDWQNLGGFALGGVVLSVLTSLVSAKLTGGGPSLTNAEELSGE